MHDADIVAVSPTSIGRVLAAARRTLRNRHLLVRQMVQMKNRISGLLTETGVSHNSRDCTR